LQLDDVQAQIVTEDDDEGEENQEAPTLPPSDKDTPRLSERENEHDHEHGAVAATEKHAAESATDDSGGEAPEDEEGDAES
jgi:hypothetical protein